MSVNKLSLFCRKCSQLSQPYQYKSPCDIFIKYFGFYHLKAQNYIDSHNFNEVDPDLMMKTIKYCTGLGYSNEDLLKSPILLKTNPITVEQHFMVMTEGGFHNITSVLLSKFIKVHRRMIADLKEFDLIKPHINVADSFISYLDPKPAGFSVNCDENKDSWAEIHMRVLNEYLQWRLGAKRDEINQLFRTHVQILRKSFRYYCQNLNFAFELGFPPSKLLKFGYILKTYPPYTRQVLAKYSNIAGTDLRQEMSWHPKLISVAPENYEKIYKLLKEHNISDDAIRRRMDVFSLSPETVAYRLEEIERVPDLRVLLTNMKMLRLMLHFGRANKRLDFLKERDWRCSSVNTLSRQEDMFDTYLKRGRDENALNDCIDFIRGLFDIDDCQYIERLKLHPFYLKVPFVAMEDTYWFLRGKNFQNDCILNAIYILLYSREKIEEAFRRIESVYCDESDLKPIDVLNLSLYFIEKEYHFTGNGVWYKNKSFEKNMLQ